MKWKQSEFIGVVLPQMIPGSSLESESVTESLLSRRRQPMSTRNGNADFRSPTNQRRGSGKIPNAAQQGMGHLDEQDTTPQRACIPIRYFSETQSPGHADINNHPRQSAKVIWFLVVFRSKIVGWGVKGVGGCLK
jgi:hypothetical protein